MRSSGAAVVRLRSCGLSVEPNSRFDESQNIENSETLVLPSRIAPAACRRATASHVESHV